LARVLLAGGLRSFVPPMKGFLFVYALVALGVIGAFRNPLIPLGVYVCFAVLRPQSMWGFAGDLGGISYIVALAALTSWAVRGFGSWQFGSRGWPIVFSLLAFSVWATLSAALVADNGPVAWRWVESLWKFVLPFLAGATLLRSQEWTRRMLWIIVLSQGYVAYEMNYSYFVEGQNRVQEFGYGGMDNNSFGIGLAATLASAVALAITSKKWALKGVALACAAFILHTTLLTFSRGAMLGLIAVGVAAFLILEKRPKQLALVAIALVVTLQLIGPELMARFESAFVETEQLDGSAAGRLQLWRDCLTVAFANPIFGIGPNHWPLVAESFGWTPFKSGHSVWMQTSAELGFPGVAFLALFFGLTFVMLWPIARTKSRAPADREWSALAIGVMLGIVGYCVSGQFVTLTGLETPYYLAMVGVGLLVNRPQETAQTVTALEQSTPPSRISPRPIPALAGPSHAGGPDLRAATRTLRPAAQATYTEVELQFPSEASPQPSRLIRRQ
jgi:probable O-glycosylation ligase (exosortase A-associated)